MKLGSLLFLSCILLSCGTKQSLPQESPTVWRGVLEIGEGRDLPFTFFWQSDSDTPLVIVNAEERIFFQQEDIKRKDDSLWISMPVFESYLLISQSDSSWQGVYKDPSRGDEYEIPFRAMPTGRRFELGLSSAHPLPSTWAVTFSPGTEDEYPAVGTFSSHPDGTVVGTFLTETGDYRYLEGYRTDQQLVLSTFDGAHAFLFVADIAGDSLSGMFYSGNHFEEPWTAVADPEASLRDASSLTFLKPRYDGISFAFPDLHGDSVRYPSEQYAGKVVIVQLLGSWCPNCMDETRLFAQWYDKYHHQGLEIIGLAFERRNDREDAARAVSRMAERLGADYEFLIASLSTSKSIANEKLPMLSDVLSYPTSIWIDRDGKIRQIHTGFNGPGTGEPYEEFVEAYEGLIQEMLSGE